MLKRFFFLYVLFFFTVCNKTNAKNIFFLANLDPPAESESVKQLIGLEIILSENNMAT